MLPSDMLNWQRRFLHLEQDCSVHVLAQSADVVHGSVTKKPLTKSQRPRPSNLTYQVPLEA